MMRHKVIVGFCLVTLLALLTVTPVAAAPQRYTDPQGRYAFTIPNGWQRDDTPAPLTPPAGLSIDLSLAAPSPAIRLLTVFSRTLPAPMSTASITDEDFSGIEDADTTRVGDIQTITVGGQAARRADYRYVTRGQNFRLIFIVGISGTTRYTLSFGALESDAAGRAEFQSILDSFVFTGLVPRRLGEG